MEVDGHGFQVTDRQVKAEKVPLKVNVILMNLFSIIEKVRQYSWRHTFESVGRLKGLLIRVSLIVSGCPTVELGLACVHFAKQVRKLKKGSGLLFTALYLKQCSVALQRYYATSTPKKLISDSSPVSVSLTRSGLPRIIPKHHRHVISTRNDRADFLVRIYLSWFGISKLIKLAKPITRSTFSSIVDKSLSFENIGTIFNLLEDYGQLIDRKYLSQIAHIPLEKGIVWEPTWKTVPNDDRIFDKNAIPNIFTSFKYEVSVYVFLHHQMSEMIGYLHSPGALYIKRTMWPFNTKENDAAAEADIQHYFNRDLPHMTKYAELVWNSTYQLRPGKLAQSIEGAGKRRIFAIGNYVKQRLLHPVHTWAMKVLKTIPTDGTFDQLRPIHRLKQIKDHQNLYSFDLKSATDRWPLAVIHTVLIGIWGTTLSSSIVISTLGMNSFMVGPPFFRGVSKPSKVFFLAGQPLGYYGSWALFTLSHHYIVWLASEMTYPNRTRPFDRYALLGDDIVIADKAVATSYRELLELMGVTISDSKSLVSDNGTLEFAKRYWSKSLTKDLSPVSMKAILITRSSLGLCALAAHYNVSRNTLFRLAGAGFRVRARLPHNRSRKWDRLWVASSKPPIDSTILLYLWLGRGTLPHPNLIGIIWWKLLKLVKPKQLVTPPSKVLSGIEADTVEFTLYLNWMQSWLKWLRWYSLLLINPNPTLNCLFSAPICNTTWKRSTFDPSVFKFGLLWKCYDMCGDQASPIPLSLDTGRIDAFRNYVVGGSSESGFILIP